MLCIGTLGLFVLKSVADKNIVDSQSMGMDYVFIFMLFSKFYRAFTHAFKAKLFFALYALVSFKLCFGFFYYDALF